MARSFANETWIIETGDSVVLKRAELGVGALSAREVLVYCVWLADYGMRNSGDVEAPAPFLPTFYSDALRIAEH